MARFRGGDACLRVFNREAGVTSGLPGGQVVARLACRMGVGRLGGRRARGGGPNDCPATKEFGAAADFTGNRWRGSGARQRAALAARLGSRGPLELLLESLGQAQRAGLGNGIGELVGDHVAVNAPSGGMVGELRLNDRFLARIEDLADQDGFELAAGFVNLLSLGQDGAAAQPFGRDVRCVEMTLSGRDVHWVAWKSEIRNPKSERKPKPEIRIRPVTGFGFRTSSGIS